jgi:hypothetical protein
MKHVHHWLCRRRPRGCLAECDRMRAEAAARIAATRAARHKAAESRSTASPSPTTPDTAATAVEPLRGEK